MVDGVMGWIGEGLDILGERTASVVEEESSVTRVLWPPLYFSVAGSFYQV